MRMMIWALVLAMAMSWAVPKEALAQAAKATIGTAVGVAGGVMITMSVVVARARLQGVYMDSAEDLIHWQSAPMILAPAAGLFFGLAGEEPLKGSIAGSVSGLLLGSVVGAGVGWAASASPEGPWAGGVIGAGIGMSIGGLGWGLRNWLRTRDAAEAGGEATPVRIGVTLPL